MKGYDLMLKLRAAYKDYIWGGNRLISDFKKTDAPQRLAESWELSCHRDGESVIRGGEYDGLTLSEYIEKRGKGVLGKNCGRFDVFPVLIKLIDATQDLSVQVHPDDEYALREEGEYGKSEMWYIVDCEEDSQIVYGVRKEIRKHEFSEAIKNNTLSDVMNYVPVRKGDVFFIEAGTLHTIGKGIVIAEIQQNSNTTYRVYDYGRKDADGKTRSLHIEKALDVTKLSPSGLYITEEPVSHDGYTSRFLSSCNYFACEEIVSTDRVSICGNENTFGHFLIVSGEGNVSGERIEKGDSLFFSAGEDIGIDGNFTAIYTYIPEKE